MTARVDLAELAQRESEQTEWKESVADINDVVATLSAFANDLQNLGGGYVVCGAKEEKDANGFQKLVRAGLTAARIKEVENTVLARCRERVSPSIAPLVDELESDDPQRRVLVFIQPATGSAHTFRRDNDGAKHWVRVSRSTLEARNGLLRDLLVRKGALEPWDRRPCNGATVNDIDLLVLRDVLTRLGLADVQHGAERYLSDSVALSAFVPPLFAREPLTGVLRPRNFAVLLFGRDVQRFIPGAVSFFSRYEGRDRSVRRGERLELASTLIDQLRQMLPALDAEVRTLFDKADAGAPSVLKYPARALREAVVNGFAHRDYELVDPLRVVAFDDRVEITSPGGLPLGASVDDLANGTAPPRWRNQALAWFLTRLGYAEAEGQGLRTIQASLRAAGCPPAAFAVGPEHVQCTLWAHPRAHG
ncbi:MAG: putative DNA binding domain-containing protein [Polyangiaceae bacterium]|nr:putative DNA binding domain-containing protein [Polyangiaceae bacterium]